MNSGVISQENLQTFVSINICINSSEYRKIQFLKAMNVTCVFELVQISMKNFQKSFTSLKLTDNQILIKLLLNIKGTSTRPGGNFAVC